MVLTLFSCNDLLDMALECSIKNVELESKVLGQATKGNNYYETIVAGVKNDPNDEDYEYNFSINGTIADGIQFSYDRNILILKGVATETGNFTFEVTVSVAFGDENTTCNESTKKTYILIVK